MWETQEDIDHTLFIHNVSERLKNNHISQCLAKINSSDETKKLRLYKTFKTQYIMEPYLTHVRDARYRVALSRFRLSSHNLEIELGRHARCKIPVNQRICKNCAMGEVEDEIHFLLKCPKFEAQRLLLLQSADLYFPDFRNQTLKMQFNLLKSPCDSDQMTQLGKFKIGRAHV